jgi:hypothetical protein
MRKKRNSKIKRKRKITALSSETKEKVLEEIEKKNLFHLESYIHLKIF